jgi:hypothetical protein
MAWTAPHEITFEREPLYEEVWTQPITKIAAKYGLSDNGLRKVCIALDIPVPARGHWARLAAGQMVERMPLPESPQRTTFVARPPAREPEGQFRTEQDDQWLAERLARETREDLRIVIDPAPPKWHPQLRELRARLQSDEVQFNKELREHEREEARRAKSRQHANSPGYSGFAWSWRVRSGGVLLDTHRAFPLRVTAATWRAAMAVANAIFVAAEKRGVTPTLDEKQGRFVLTLEGTSVYFAVRERFEQAWRDEVETWSGRTRKEKYTKGTGRLFIAFYKNGWDYRQFHADENAVFDDLSAILFAPLYRKVVEEREERRAQAERERQQEIDRRKQQEVEHQRAVEAERQRELARLAAIERHRETALLKEARTWEAVAALRRYIAARCEPGAHQTSQEWLAWARGVAQRHDPTARVRTSSDGSEYGEP